MWRCSKLFVAGHVRFGGGVGWPEPVVVCGGLTFTYTSVARTEYWSLPLLRHNYSGFLVCVCTRREIGVMLRRFEGLVASIDFIIIITWTTSETQRAGIRNAFDELPILHGWAACHVSMRTPRPGQMVTDDAVRACFV